MPRQPAPDSAAGHCPQPTAQSMGRESEADPIPFRFSSLVRIRRKLGAYGVGADDSRLDLTTRVCPARHRLTKLAWPGTKGSSQQDLKSSGCLFRLGAPRAVSAYEGRSRLSPSPVIGSYISGHAGDGHSAPPSHPWTLDADGQEASLGLLRMWRVV